MVMEAFHIAILIFVITLSISKACHPFAISASFTFRPILDNNVFSTHFTHSPSKATFSYSSSSSSLFVTQEGINADNKIPLNAQQLSLTPIPSSIQTSNLSKSFPPPNLLSKLFSSVPKREFALKDVALSFGSTKQHPSSMVDDKNDGVVLLVGASASGKSTLLRMLSGKEVASGGTVTINGMPLTKNKNIAKPNNDGPSPFIGYDTGNASHQDDAMQNQRIRPVIVDSKPEPSLYNNGQTIRDVIIQVGHDHAPPTIAKSAANSNDYDQLVSTMADDFCKLLGLYQNDDLPLKQPSQLSPTEQFLFGIACACMESVCPALLLHSSPQSESIALYPILLLDELFDREHPDISRRVGMKLLNLIEVGGVVIAATHKPHALKDVSRRTITLCAGKVISDKLT